MLAHAKSLISKQICIMHLREQNEATRWCHERGVKFGKNNSSNYLIGKWAVITYAKITEPIIEANGST